MSFTVNAFTASMNSCGGFLDKTKKECQIAKVQATWKIANIVVAAAPVAICKHLTSNILGNDYLKNAHTQSTSLSSDALRTEHIITDTPHHH